MPLLLTLLSVVSAVVFVSVLGIALLLIFKTLQSVQRNLEQIAMGVRAIEKETKPLEKGAVAFSEELIETNVVYAATGDRLNDLDRAFDRAAAALTPRI